jgi:hypothetical protein
MNQRRAGFMGSPIGSLSRCEVRRLGVVFMKLTLQRGFPPTLSPRLQDENSLVFWMKSWLVWRRIAASRWCSVASKA